LRQDVVAIVATDAAIIILVVLVGMGGRGSGRSMPSREEG
jgi:hypothetical protein